VRLKTTSKYVMYVVITRNPTLPCAFVVLRTAGEALQGGAEVQRQAPQVLASDLVRSSQLL
jgi:hypothetical protein